MPRCTHPEKVEPSPTETGEDTASDCEHEGCDSAIDTDTDTSTDADADADADGFASVETGGEDCDDSDAEVHPGADELPYDGVNNDCDASTPDDDLDGDAFGIATDCDDTNDAVYPGAEEICGDGVVNDCDLPAGEPVEACSLPSVVDLSEADLRLYGEVETGHVGHDVSSAGDVDGDGLPDLLLGASGDTDAGSYAGAAYVVTRPLTGLVSLSTATAKLLGEVAYDSAGSAVSTAGDMDSDGYSDLLLGVGSQDVGGDASGTSYVVMGPVTGTLSLSEADATLIGEAARDYAGNAASTGGDVDGDGQPDLLIGAYLHQEGGVAAGVVYVVLAPVSGTGSLSDADAKLIGEAKDDYAGKEVDDAGDVNGDGLADIVIGARAEDTGASGAGAAYLVQGPVSGSLSLADADAKRTGESSADTAGYAVGGAGDVDGDGHDDLLISAVYENVDTDSAGAVYLVLGPLSGVEGLAGAHAKLLGEARSDMVGESVSSAGDMDGDGFSDLLVGARREGTGGSDAGAIYLVRAPDLGHKQPV